jgi:choline dehydrogenase
VNLKHETPGVGQNLQDHLQIRPCWRVENVPTLNEQANSVFGRIRMGLEYAVWRTGPLSAAPSQLGGFVRSGPEAKTPNLEYHIQPLSLDSFGSPLHRHPGFTASVCNLRPKSRGHVNITSSDPHKQPAIQPNFLAHEEDQRVAIESLRLTRRIVEQPALAPYCPQEHSPGPHVTSDADLLRAAATISTTIFHPCGTCRMGNDSLAVVDDRLRVHGLQRLRIADASVFPTIPSGNTAVPVMMVANKLAAMIRGER